jgi:L-threonylcarbamoyladenylate synthase
MITTPADIKKAALALSEGGVIAYPTEAVWGLGCDPKNEAAVTRLLAIKQRPVAKGLILIAATLEQLAPFLGELTSAEQQRLSDAWPGFTTFVVPASAHVPAWIKGNFSRVALRVSAHPLVADLCHAFGGPLVSSSANRAGQAPAQSFEQTVDMFPQELAYVLPGDLGGAQKPSAIIDVASGQCLR